MSEELKTLKTLKTLKKLAAKMQSRREDVRYYAARKLSEITSPQVTDILIGSLEKEENSNTISVLSEALTKFRELKVIACLCKKLESEEFPFWDLQPVINALCKMQDKQALPALIDYVRDKRKPWVNKSIIVDNLAGLADKTTLYLLARFLQSHSTQAFFTLQQLNRINFKAVANLTALLSDPSAYIREEVVYLLGNYLSQSVKITLMKVLINDSNEEVRNSAKFVLRDSSTSPLLPDLISILKENKKSVYYKLHSTKSGQFGGENVFALIEHLNTEDKNLEAEAILSQITSSEILSMLFSVFKNSKHKVQEMILDMLGDNCDFESLPFLKKTLQDRNLEIRTRAAIYLAKQEKFVKALDTKEKKLLVKILTFALTKNTKNFYAEDVISTLSQTDCLLVNELNLLEIQPLIPSLLKALKKGSEYTRRNAIKILEKIELQHRVSNEEFIFCLVKMAKSSYSLNDLAAETLLAISPAKKMLVNETLIDDLLETLTNSDVNKVTYQVLEKTIHSDIVPNLLKKARYENDVRAIKSLKELAPSRKTIKDKEDVNWLENLAKKYNEMHKKVALELSKYKKGLKLQEQEPQELQEPHEEDLCETLKDLQTMPKLLGILVAKGELYNKRASLEKIACKEKTSNLIEILTHSDVNMRKWATESLAARRSKKAVLSLVINLKDIDFGVRACAALALGQIASIKAVPSLIEALKDENSNVRELSAYALNEITKRRKIKNLKRHLISLLSEALIEVLAKGGEKASVYAAIVLGRICSDEVVPALIQTLTSPSAYLRAKSAEALGQIASSKAVPYLVKLLEDNFDYVCVSSIEALGQIKSKQVLPILIEKLNCDSPSIKATIIKAFGQIKSSKTYRFLIEASENNDEHIRQAAAFSLGEVGEAKFVPILIKMTKDPEIKVQKEAIEALSKISTLETTQILDEIGNDIEVNAYLRQIASSLKQKSH